MANQLVMFFVDDHGTKATASIWVDDSVLSPSDVSILIDAVQDLLSAELVRATLIIEKELTGYAALTSPYDVADKVLFRIRDLDGRAQKVVVAAPNPNIFFEDDDVVDASLINVDAFLEVCYDNLFSRGGVKLDLFYDGVRSRRNRSRKFQ